MIKMFVTELDDKPTFLSEAVYGSDKTTISLPEGEHTIRVYKDEFYPTSIEKWVKEYLLIDIYSVSVFTKCLCFVLHATMCPMGYVVKQDNIDYITSRDILAIRVRVNNTSTHFPIATKQNGWINNELTRALREKLNDVGVI